MANMNEQQGKNKGEGPLLPVLPLSGSCRILIEKSKEYSRKYEGKVAMSSHLLLALLRDGEIAEALLQNGIDPNKGVSLLLQSPGALFAVTPDLNGDGLTRTVRESIYRASLIAQKQGLREVMPVNLLQGLAGLGANILAHAYSGDLDKIRNLKTTSQAGPKNQ